MDCGVIFIPGFAGKVLHILLSLCPNHAHYFNFRISIMEHGCGNINNDGKPPGDKPLFHCCGIVVFLFTYLKKKAMDKIKDNWKLAVLITLLSVGLSTLGTLVVTSINAKNTTLNDAASVNYVDNKSTELKGYIDTQDGEMKNRICIIEDDMKGKADKSDIAEIKQILRDQNSMLFKILETK
jgi:hypothetical protein